jgi:hypothetical protein
LVFNLYYGDIRHHPEKLAIMQEVKSEANQIIFAKPGIRQVFIKTFTEAFRQGAVGAAQRV